jgi:hypothetical protein
MLLRNAAGGGVVVLRAVAAGGLRAVMVLQAERRGRHEQGCQAENRDERAQWVVHLF